MKRFYKEVSVSAEGAVLLDGRPVKTPRKRPLVLPRAALAEAVAREWRAQRTEIDPATMFHTKLANTAIDRVAGDRPRIIAEMGDYAGNDLVCYRADRPPDLVASQKASWDPVLAFAASALQAPLVTAIGMVHVPQPDASLAAIARHLEELDSFTLTGLHNAMTLTGSLLIPLMAHAGELAAEAAWEAAHVDEDHQIAHWGWDAEARARRSLRHREYHACFEFLALLRAA